MRWTAASQRSLILSSAIRRKQSVTANELQLKETSCTGTIIDLLDQAGAMFPANTLNLEINTGTSEAAISTVSLGRIVINLAKNVFDHALPPISFSVKVIEFQSPTFFQHPPNAITSGTYWELMCEDSGPGIHPDVLKNIPNATTKSGPGHAMGIKNILEIAQQAGGGMSMESTHPGSTKVRVFIPVLSDGQAALHMAA